MSAIAAAFLAACEAELVALKPGNVHIHGDGHGMTVVDFRRSAAAAASAIAAPGRPVGERVLAAVRATRAAVGQNTNLGILLLCAPLAAAAERTGPLAVTVREVLDGLDRADAAAAYEAVRLADPGGLGTVPEADVHLPPSIGLLEAMRLAADRDRIAWNYANGLRDVVGRGVALLDALAGRGWDEPWVVTGTYMALLARIPDTHVARRHGAGAARALCRRVLPPTRRLLASHSPAELRGELLALDGALKAEAINPGTTADLTVAACFACRLMAEGWPPARPPLP